MIITFNEKEMKNDMLEKMRDGKVSVYVQKCWSRPLFASIILFAIFFAIFVSIFMIAKGDPIPDDQYFHYKYAYLLRTEGWDVVEHFKWIQLSPEPTGGSRYTANLFQVSLIPFTYFSDGVWGIRVAEAFYASIFIAIIYYIMRKERVRYPLFFVLLLVSSTWFMGRLLLSRAFIVMLGLIFLEMYFAIRKKYVPLTVVTFFHVLWHQNTYFMPLIIVGIVETSRFFLERKVDIKNILVIFFASVVGMAFFPGFPKSLFGWIGTLVGISGNGSSMGTEADSSAASLGGNELLTIDFSANFLGIMVIFILCGLSIPTVMYLYTKQRQEQEQKPKFRTINQVQLHWVYSLFVFLMAVLVGSTAISGRFFDFVFPAITLLTGFAVTILLDSKFIAFQKSTIEWLSVFLWVFISTLAISVGVFIYKQANTFDYEPARQASAWIDENSESGDKVYMSNWSHFNMMFFTNSNNVYSMGLEPYSLKMYDESLYWKYYNIATRKYYCEVQGDCMDEIKDIFKKQGKKAFTHEFKKENSRKLIESIKNDFGSKLILSDSKALNEVMSLNPELIESEFEIKSKKYEGAHMQLKVFKLK